ncbi:hypothetical protein ACVWW1_000679 [Bradyrhizobium sp. JR3.5]
MRIRRSEEVDVVEYDQCQGQHRGDAQDVHRVRQRGEAPLRRSQVGQIADHDAEQHEPGQNAQQMRQAIGKEAALETQVEARQQRKRRRERVMHQNQEIAQGEL